MNKPGKLLGVDFGRSKVGLAVSNDEQNMVFRRGIIKDYKSLDKLFVLLREIVEKENIVNVVLGVPLSSEGEKTEQSGKIVVIGKKLEAFLKKKMVLYQDESFSTFEANKKLTQIGEKGVAGGDDDMAAFIILSDYLERAGSFKK